MTSQVFHNKSIATLTMTEQRNNFTFNTNIRYTLRRTVQTKMQPDETKEKGAKNPEIHYRLLCNHRKGKKKRTSCTPKGGKGRMSYTSGIGLRTQTYFRLLCHAAVNFSKYP